MCSRVVCEKGCFSLQNSSDAYWVSGACHGFHKGSGTVAFVHAQVGPIVVLFGQGEAVFLQGLLEGQEVRSFIVGDHAVEVEDDGAKPGLVHNDPPWQALTLPDQS